ncbi:MAG: acetylxylan esterase [Planctomycetia bacterium]|nr:acetylxylan esterase [Planctomycetia bacterium]
MKFEQRNQAPFSRRDMLKWASIGASSLCLPTLSRNPLTSQLLAQNEKATPATQPLNRFSRVVQDWFVDQVRLIEERIIAEQSALKTKEDAEAYVKTVQTKIRRCFGPEPERTPLNARVMKVVEREQYRIENVIFESRPGMLVTANLYLPKNRKGPFPGAIGSCGHSANGKAGDAYQPFAQTLAKLGYACLIFDPIGQGERLQYVDEQLKPKRGIGVAEHIHAGNQQFLVGEFFGAWRAWDGIRALDYLLTREEVDPKHIGITGNSGGGTMTTWLCGLERRWTMAAPGCFVTTFRRNLENELPADTEQCPPRVLAEGLDHSDFLAAMAPKPVIILAKERDFFDVRGATEAYLRLKRIYSLLGKPDNVQLQIGPTEHGYSVENREAMYRFFNRAVGLSPIESEPEPVVEKDEVLWCTPHGQVAELKSRTIFSFTSEKSRALTANRKPIGGDELKAALRDTLKLPNLETPPEYRILRPIKRNYPKLHATHYAIETEPNMFALVTLLTDKPHYSRPPQTPPRAILYVAHHSADVELTEEPLVRELLAAEPGAAFYALDVRGIGESRPDTCGADQFTKPYGSDFFYSAHSIMLDRPYVGQKTFDVLRVLEWLATFGQRDIHLAAKGWGTLPATFAAVLTKTVTQVTLKESLDSYASIAEDEDYIWPLSSFVPGVLSRFDLPDCYCDLKETKKLRRA